MFFDADQNLDKEANFCGAASPRHKN